MTRKLIIALFAAMALTLPASAYINIYVPFASMDAPAGQSGYQDDGDANLTPLPANFLSDPDHNGTLVITTLHGYDSLGGSTQAEANARVSLVQIWGWHDTNGDLKADAADAVTGVGCTRWKILWQASPNGSVAGLQVVDVTGWNVGNGATPDLDGIVWSTTNILGTGTPLDIPTGQSWLILLRVIDSTGNSNLMATVGGAEEWDDGDTSNAIGSNIPGDKYLDINGNAGAITDGDVLGVYVYP